MSESLFSLFSFAAFRNATRRFSFGNRQQPRELSVTSLKVAETNSYDVPADKTPVTVYSYGVNDSRTLRLLAIQPAEGNTTLFAELSWFDAAAGNQGGIIIEVPQHVPLVVGSGNGFDNADLASGNATQLRTVRLINNGGSVLGAEVAIAYE